jgi:hypothetical protein
MESINQFFDHNGKSITDYFYQYGYVSLLAYNGDKMEDSPISVFNIDNTFGKFNINVENILKNSVAVYLQSL